MAKSLILRDLISKLRYSISEFEATIGVPAGRIYKSIKRNTDISLDTVQKIITAFPIVSKEWLETGDGLMFAETPEQKQQAEDNKRLETMGKIATGNRSIKVEDLGNPNTHNNFPDKNKGKFTPDEKQKEHLENEDDDISLSDKTQIGMVNRYLALLEHKERNMEKLISNNEKFANGLIMLIERLGISEEEFPVKKVSAKA